MRRKLPDLIPMMVTEEYQRQLEKAVRKHNKLYPDQKWTVMKQTYGHVIKVMIPGEERFCEFVLTVCRIRIAKMRGKGSTFTFLGDLLMPYSHFLTSQAARLLLEYLGRKDKEESLRHWVDWSLPGIGGVSAHMLETLFRKVCESLQISFGERPSKLYRCAHRYPDLPLADAR